MADPVAEIILAGVRTALTLFDVLAHAHARERRADRRNAAGLKKPGEADSQSAPGEERTGS